MNTNIHLWLYLADIILDWEIFQTKVVEKIKTLIFCSVTFSPENPAMYETVWKNMQEPDRPQITLSKTHSEYVTLISFLR